jgi:flagellar hook assembly protein FlgD
LNLAADETRLVRLELADDAGKLTVRIDDASQTTRGAHVTAQISRPADVSVAVLNAAGRVVRSSALGERPQGQVEVLWDGRSDAGSSMPSGSYVLLIRAEAADGQRATARVGVSR